MSEVLYHYTSVSGLMGIITSKQLWATQIQYLNDSHEVKDAVLVGKRSIQTQYSDRSKPEFRKWLFDRLDNIDGANTLVASFSENGDQLSQWRGYCPDGGFSIGFSKEGLIERAKKFGGFQFKKCIYGALEKERVLNRIIEAAFDCYDRLGEPWDYAKQCELDKDFYRDFLLTATSIKNETFHEEAEWRLIGGPFRPDHPLYKWRAGKDSLLPFMAFPLDERPPIVSICQGPCRDPGYAMQALNSFMWAQKWPDFDKIKFLRTQTSLRPKLG